MPTAIPRIRPLLPLALLAALLAPGCDGDAPSAPADPPAPARSFDWDPADLVPRDAEIVAQPGSGTSRLQGVVTDAEGRPLEGATVEMHAIPRADYPLGYCLHASATTAADGSFDVGPGPSPWWSQGIVSARAPGYARTSLRSRRVSTGDLTADEGEPVRIPLRKGYEVRGAIRATDGGGPDGPVRVVVAGPPNYFEMAVADPEGNFRFTAPAGEVVVTALEGPHPRAEAKVRVVPGAENAVRIEVRRGRDVKGRVVSATTGAPVPGAVIRCSYGKTVLFRSDGEGRFTLPNLWFPQFQVRAPGFAVRTHLLAADAGTPAVGEETIRLAPGFVGRGRVLDLEGRPLEGVRTLLLRRDERGLVEATAGPPSRADGSFDFVGLPLPGEGREVRIFASGNGLGFGASAPVAGAAGSVVEGIEIRVPRLVEVAGRLEDEKGEPCTGTLRVRWDLPPALDGYRDWVQDRTAFRPLDDGTWSVRVPERAALHIETAGEEFGGAEWEGTTPVAGPLVLHAYRGVPLEGVVVDAKGERVTKGEVRVEPNPPTDPRPSRDARVARDGTFSVKGLKPGKYDISVLVHPEFLQEVVRGVEPGGEPVRVTLRRPGGLRVLIAFPKDAPRSPVHVALRALEDAKPLEDHLSRDVDPADLLLELERLAPVAWRATLVAGDYRADLPRVEIAEGEPTELGTVLLEKAPAVAGTVRCGGRPAPGAEVEVLQPQPDGHSESVGRALTAMDGTYRVPALRPGAYVLTAHPLDGPLVQMPVEVTAGADATLDVEVPAGGRLRVRAVDAAGRPVAGARVTIFGPEGGVAFRRPASRAPGPHFTGEDGRLLCLGLPAGDLRVAVDKAEQGRGEARVSVTGGSETEVEVPVR